MFLQFFTPSGALAVGYQLFTYAAGTSTKQATWTDSTQTTPSPNPVILDAQGSCSIWLDPTLKYKYVLALPTDTDPPQSPVRTQDNIESWVTSQVLYPITAAETSAGVTINGIYPPGNMLRYGLVPNSFGAAGANTVIAKAIFNWNLPDGPVGDFFFPNLTGADIYYFNDMILFRPGCHLHVNGCTLSCTRTGLASDVNAGFIFATQDFTIEDFNIVLNYTGGTPAFSAVQLGGRDIPVSGSELPTIFDSLLPNWTLNRVPMGNMRFLNGYISSNNSTGTVVQMLGGLVDVVFENVTVDGLNVCDLGFYGEFGWATNQGSEWQRQTSHPHNIRFINCRVKFLNTAYSGAAGVSFNGGYNILIDGLYVNGMASACEFSSGESLFFNPWSGVDDIGSVEPNGRLIRIRNVVGRALTQNGIDIGGATQANPSAGTHSGYLGWKLSTVYAVNDYAFNGAQLYICTTAGMSATSGGPTGTGTGISDGAAVWNFSSVAAPYETEQLYGDIEACSMDGVAGAGGYGIHSSAGQLTVKNCKLTNFQRGIVTTDECTSYQLDTCKILNSSSFGIQIGQATDVYASARFSSGSIRNCTICGSGTNGSASAAISGHQIGSLSLECNLFGYTTGHDNITETAQTSAITVDSTCSGVVCRGNNVAAVASGVAYAQVGGSNSNGNTVTQPQGIITTSGYWDNVLAGVSPDRGAITSATLTPGVDYQTQYFNTALTGTCTLTLSATGATGNTKWRIVGTGTAVASHSISVGGLKSISSAGWCDVQYDVTTSAFIETAFGAL